MLSRVLYAFLKIIAKNRMHYDITAAICKIKGGILHMLLKYFKEK